MTTGITFMTAVTACRTRYRRRPVVEKPAEMAVRGKERSTRRGRPPAFVVTVCSSGEHMADFLRRREAIVLAVR